MDNSYLGLSPSLLIKQALQPFVVSSAEVGFKNIIWAYKILTKKKKKKKKKIEPLDLFRFTPKKKKKK